MYRVFRKMCGDLINRAPTHYSLQITYHCTSIPYPLYTMPFPMVQNSPITFLVPLFQNQQLQKYHFQYLFYPI